MRNFWTLGGERKVEMRKGYNEELHNWHSLPASIRMVKSRRMSWAGHIARIGAVYDGKT